MFGFATILITVAVVASSAAIAPAAPAPADKPSLKKIDLWENELGGAKSYRIPGIVVTAKGTLLAYCEARRDGPGDWGEITTVLRRSTDGGKTWDKPRQIAHMAPRIEGLQVPNSADKQIAGNPVAIADADGTVHFVYCINYERSFYMKSSDDGVSWSKPVEITPTFETFRPEVQWNVIATGPTHGIQLKTGRLVVPVWLSFGPKGTHGPSVSATIFSDDHGVTWKRGDVALPNAGEIKSPNECVVVELSDGRVMMNGRSPSDSNRRLITVSPDGAKGWSKPSFDQALIEPICCAGLTSYAPTPGTLVFSNPDNLKVDEEGKPVAGGVAKRRNVSIKVSRDDGTSWISNRTLEEGASGYSDLATLKDGTILCFYERDLRLTVARFNLAWALAKPTEDQ